MTISYNNDNYIKFSILTFPFVSAFLSQFLESQDNENETARVSFQMLAVSEQLAKLAQGKD